MTMTGRPPRLSSIFQKYQPPLYFVTMCCANRKHLLAEDAVHAAFREFAIRGQRDRDVAVGRYVLMPDHLHLFVCGPAEFKLDQWTRMLKTTLGKKLQELGHKPEFWQRGFFDHLIRNLESYSEKWEYVRENPVRAGLISRAEDWPYQGEIEGIDRV
jgi:putative transposase